MSKSDTVVNLDADKLRKLLSDMIENRLLLLSDIAYIIKGKDTIEKALPEISTKHKLFRVKQSITKLLRSKW